MPQRTTARLLTLPQRLLDEREVAEYLGRDPSWLRANRQALADRGFPEPLPGLDRWDRAAVDRWLDRLGDAGAALVFSD